MHILPANTPVTKRETVFYGLFGGGGFAYSYIMFSSVILYYFTDVLGIAAGAAGVLLLIARIWDGINDPLMGILIDKTHTRWGKNRPYIFIGGILMAVFTVLLFTKPDFESEGSKLAWAYFTYIGYGMSYTMCTIALGSLPSRLTTDRHGIAKMASSFFAGSSVMSILASLTLMSSIATFSGPEGNMARGYQSTAILAAAILLLFVVILSVSVKERDLQGENPPQIKFFEAIKVMFSNVHYWGFMLTQGVAIFGYYLSAGTILYYCIYNLGSQTHYTPLLVCDYATPIIAALVIPGLVKKMDRKSIVVISLLTVGVAYLLRYLTGDTNTFVMVLLAGIGGIAMGFFNVLFNPIALDCAIFSEHKTGLQLQGSFVAANSILTKCAAGLSGALLGFILNHVGYVENAPAQSDQVLSALKLCATLSVSVAAVAGAILFCLMYRLKNGDLEEMNERNITRRNIRDINIEE